MGQDATPARRVGVEIEFAGLSVSEAARVIADALGGRPRHETSHVVRLEDTGIGCIRLELDTRYAKPAAEPDFLDWALEELELRTAAADVLSVLVPVELVTEPLDEAGLETLDRGIAALREAGAVGTRNSAVNAFGMHLNVACAPAEPGRAVRIGAAFAFVEPWLRRQLGIDIARRATPFVDPYPPGYVRGLARACLTGIPQLASFIPLYAHWNPTRNRGLDLWPLLGYLDADASARALQAPIKGPRPAFHYRLPDSRIEVEGWGPQQELGRWNRIERAALDPARFSAARSAALRFWTWRAGRSEYEATISAVMA